MAEAKAKLDIGARLECVKIAAGVVSAIYGADKNPVKLPTPESIASAIEIITKNLYEVV